VGNTKSLLFAYTFGNSGVDESKTSGPETHAKKVVDNGDMVDALSRVLEQKSLEKRVDSGSGRRDYALFEALLSAFLNSGPDSFTHRRIWDPGMKISSRQHLEGKVIVKE
nr:hypothetical protein [Tanacetum cinerariifolium]